MSDSRSSLSVSQLLAVWGQPNAPLLIDVRREDDFVAAGRTITGSLRTPATDLTGALPRDARTVVVFCAHGRSVSQSACDLLVAAGFNAAYLEGGYSAWVEAGAPTTPIA